MKALKLFLIIIFVTSISLTLNAQNSTKSSGQVKTETLKVNGACSMCKSRIEKTAKEEGAVTAAWDQKTKILSVSFDPSRTSVNALEKKLASVGHDTEKYRAPDDVYAKLPGCCHYDRAK